MTKITRFFAVLTALMLLLTACASGGQVMDGEVVTGTSEEISIADNETEAVEESGSDDNETEAAEEESPTNDRTKTSEEAVTDENVLETPGTEGQATDESETRSIDVTEEDKPDMKLKIGDTEVPVTWEDNDSVAELKALSGETPLTIQMSMYGGFEQVGPIGQSIVRDDRQTTTESGDIVLYSGNQIVLFYGSNSWAYTRLGHVDLSQEEMRDLLGNGDVVLTLQYDK